MRTLRIARPRTGRSVTTLLILLVALGMAAAPARADVRLPHILGDNMVLQRGIPVPVWGWAEPGEKVTVTLAGHSASATARADGRWMVKLPAMNAGGPYRMTVAGANRIELGNILVGEVWICSGQSNMSFGIRMADNAQEEIAAATYPRIRLFQVPRGPSGLPVQDVEAAWTECTPESVGAGGWGGFSAVAYFFGRDLHNALNVPIGLIDCSEGATHIETWIPPEGFASVPALQAIAENVEKTNRQYRETLAASLDELEAWVRTTRKALAEGGPITQGPRIEHPFTSGVQAPTSRYFAMVYPILPFAIRGVIWYQGEGNWRDGMLYFEKMKALIGSWRAAWGRDNLPFYYVQIAPLDQLYEGEALARLREAQTAALAIPNTGMVVTTDIGALFDIHPKNKQDVGKRLALWALARTYGKEGIVYSGPLYKAMQVEGAAIRITFDHTGSGLASRDGQPLTWFQIAGDDKVWHDATARIDPAGNTVLVSSPDVPKPVAVRFGWARQAVPNLVNKEGLPASPFRTDEW